MAKSKAGDLFLGSVVHVIRGSKEKPETVTIPSGQFVSETDLKADEIEDLKRRGVLRAGTVAEIEAAENREENQSAAEAIRAQEQEAKDLAATQKLEKDQLDAKQKADAAEEQRKLDEQQAKEREAAAKKAAGSGKKK